MTAERSSVALPGCVAGGSRQQVPPALRPAAGPGADSMAGLAWAHLICMPLLQEHMSLRRRRLFRVTAPTM